MDENREESQNSGSGESDSFSEEREKEGFGFFHALGEGLRRHLNPSLWRFIRGQDLAPDLPENTSAGAEEPSSSATSVSGTGRPEAQTAANVSGSGTSSSGAAEQGNFAAGSSADDWKESFQSKLDAHAARPKTRRARRKPQNVAQMEFPFHVALPTGGVSSDVEPAGISDSGTGNLFREEASAPETTGAPDVSEPAFSPFTEVGTEASYEMPGDDFWTKYSEDGVANEAEAEERCRQIQAVLDEFRIDAEVRGYQRGPQVTQYRIFMATGERVERITASEKELTMRLAVKSLLIQAPVPGESFVGIELPNENRGYFAIGNLFAGTLWKSWADGGIPLMMGRKINGEDLIYDLTRAPHMLIAGTTGSGKSFCLNSMIVSMVARFSPEELRLILVDPKSVEMTAYGELPHLLVPIVTDVKLVSLALRWLVIEMNRRYHLFTRCRSVVRNLRDYNSRPRAEEPELDENGNPIPQKLPFLVAVVDEVGDIMLQAKREVSDLLSALAGKARAAGIHLILATQNPNVQVISGTIKANFPTRVGLRVTTQTESRVILDSMGAEKLLGNGDMLLKGQGMDAGFYRLQGPAVPEEDIGRLMAYIRQQRPAAEAADFEWMKQQTGGMAAGGAEGEEALCEPEEDEIDRLREALEFFLEKKRASASSLQRKFSIGYNTAARMMERLEELGALRRDPSNRYEILVDSPDELF